MAPWLARRGLHELAAVYLCELELVSHGVPAGPLLLCRPLSQGSQRRHVFDVASQPRFEPWIAALGRRLATRQDAADRPAVLAEADEAMVARRLRRAVQLYGWLMLTARTDDNAMRWSLTHLQRLAAAEYLRTDLLAAPSPRQPRADIDSARG